MRRNNLREKKLRLTSVYDNMRGDKYDRTFVRKSEATFLPFSKTSKSDKWGYEYWYEDKKLKRYVCKLIRKYVGKTYEEFMDKYIHLGWKHRERAYTILDSYLQTSVDKERYGRIIKYFYLDENDIIRENERYCYRNRKQKPNFTQEQLKHNDSVKIPEYGDVEKYGGYEYPYPYKYASYTRNGMTPIGKFYVTYKGEILLLPVYHLPRIPGNYRGNERKFAEFGERYKPIDIYTPAGKVNLIHNRTYIVSYDVTDTITGETVTKYKTLNKGYGNLNTYIIVEQAEAELRKRLPLIE